MEAAKSETSGMPLSDITNQMQQMHTEDKQVIEKKVMKRNGE